MTSIRETYRADPVGTAIVALLATLIVLLGVQMYLQGVHGITYRHYFEWTTTINRESPPPSNWLATAKDGDVLRVSGYGVAYWGNPRLAYGETATREREKPRGIVFHYPMAVNPVKLIQNVIHAREHRGYHFLVTQDGRVFQAAPLSKRTNHIKPHSHRARKPFMQWADNKNTIGIAIMDGCVLKLGSGRAITNLKCEREKVSEAARAAALAVAKTLQLRYGMACDAVAGHGMLQTDREDFEGEIMTKAVLETCNRPRQIEARLPPFQPPMALGGAQ